MCPLLWLPSSVAPKSPCLPADRVDFCLGGASSVSGASPSCVPQRLQCQLPLQTAPVHHVRVDHLVALQHLLRRRHAVPGDREAVPRGRLRVHAAHRGDRSAVNEECCEWGAGGGTGAGSQGAGAAAADTPATDSPAPSSCLTTRVGASGTVQRHLRHGHEERHRMVKMRPRGRLHVQAETSQAEKCMMPECREWAWGGALGEMMEALSTGHHCRGLRRCRGNMGTLPGRASPIDESYGCVDIIQTHRE